jgi:uncharacterized ferritin-like protein (DUF455 family)
VLHNFSKGIAQMVESVEKYPWKDKKAYGLYLSQTYYYVVHSTRLLALAAGNMKIDDTPFHRRFLEHAHEEKGHEIMVLNDMKALGFDINDFPELPHTRLFWEPQYYKIEHIDPLTLMGYIIALETIACSQCPRVKKMIEGTYPKESMSFVTTHGDDDPDHVQKAWQLINSLPEQRKKWIEENFAQTVVAYNFMVDGIVQKLKEEKLLNVA